VCVGVGVWIVCVVRVIQSVPVPLSPLTPRTAVMPMHFVCVCPEGFSPDAETLERARAGGVSTVEVTHDPAGVAGSDVVYTDVWASMGQKEEADERKKLFDGFQVNTELMAQAKPDAIFLHCLPAERGTECTDEVVEAPYSKVFDQAENRQWAQMAILLKCLNK